ncbi:hypothetical protein H0H93_015694, partial [Arthromyces matolae]
YVAERILKINENKRWRDPPPSNPEALARQDEEIFQTAKLIKFVFYNPAIQAPNSSLLAVGISGAPLWEIMWPVSLARRKGVIGI